jgi:CRISPR-associated protein (TIGR02710 family)
MARKAMIISVGGSVAPVIHSLNRQRPDYVAYLVSPQSRIELEQKISPLLDFQPVFQDIIEVDSAEDLMTISTALYSRVRDLIEKWKGGDEELDVIVDYTGGTKSMSAALALSAMEHASRFSYIGGAKRTKDGLGIVIDGEERIYYYENPWDRLAVVHGAKVALLFNKRRFKAALELIESFEHKLGDEQKLFFESLKDVVRGYDLWDRFHHSDAQKAMRKGLTRLEPFCAAKGGAHARFCSEVKANAWFLEELLKSDATGRAWYLCYDLLGNAGRRADEGRYDDAVARLYRTLELIGSATLREKYGIDASNASPGQIPQALREEFVRKYLDPEKSALRIPLYGAYSLLNELGDTRGRNFIACYDSKVKPLLDVRNMSILAHGLNPVKEDMFRKLIDAIISFSGLDIERIPEFPCMEV